MITPPHSAEPDKSETNLPLSSKKKVRTIDSLWTFVVATAVLGPFALPLLWRNPRFRWSTKVWGSAAVVAFTWLLLKVSASFLGSQMDQFQMLQQQQQLLRQQGF